MRRAAQNRRDPAASAALRAIAAAALIALLASGCSIHSRRATAGTPGFEERGIASWYGPGFHGKLTANGEAYDMHGLTAAHRKLPFGTVVEVRNRDNGRRVRVRINDRGPFVRGRIIDLSRGAAEALDMIGPGIAKVSLRVVSGPPRTGPESRRWLVQAGAFRDRGHAEAHLRRVQSIERGARLETAGEIYRVVVGPLESRRSADRIVEGLERQGVAAFSRRSG